MRTWLISAMILGLAACHHPPTTTPTGTIDWDPAVLRVGPLDGIAGNGHPTGPAQSGIAWRKATAAIQELYGSFLFDEQTPIQAPWSGIGAFTDVTLTTFSFAGGSGTVTAMSDKLLRVTIKIPGATRVSAAFRCAADEHFQGLGAQTQITDLRGENVPLWISEQGIGRADSDEAGGDWFLRGARHATYFSVPFFVSSRGYGIEVDDSKKTVFDFCNENSDAWRAEIWSDELAFFIYLGPTVADVLQQHADRVGHPPAPPDFAFAPWNDAIHGASNVRRVANLLRSNHIASSAIWTEDWGGGEQVGDNYNIKYGWTVDQTLYPDMKAMTDALHANGFKFLGYFNTFTESDAAHYAEVTQKGYLIHHSDGSNYTFDGVRFKPSSMLDLSNAGARDRIAQAMNGALDVGMDGWMADFAEWLPADATLADGADPMAAHNLYAVAWQQLNDQVLSARTDGVDRLTFVRSGYTGSQAIGHQIVWGGDQTTDFDPGDGLPTVIPIGVNLGMVGMPYYGSDVAGYFSGFGHPVASRELFYRWVTLGALSPVMRTHHGIASTQNWNLESDAASMAHYKRWAGIHTQLFPYLRRAADDAVKSGLPMMRSLALLDNGANSATAWQTKDEFGLGPSLLVAPIVTEGATSRSVFLPPGDWMRAFSDAPGRQHGTIDVQAALEEIPVFARTGTVLVMLPANIETLTPATAPVVDRAAVGDDREVHLFVGADGHFEEGNLSYTLTGAVDLVGSVTWNGVTLSACGTVPCGTIDGAKQQAVFDTVGPGTLNAGTMQAVFTGGAADRKLHIVVHW